jgi:hypothetical protein
LEGRDDVEPDVAGELVGRFFTIGGFGWMCAVASCSGRRSARGRWLTIDDAAKLSSWVAPLTLFTEQVTSQFVDLL